ncbi:hypothetical protein EYF80_058600 [Liparis tanakae]|uniref:Uncharacterized protein n=1 Tax=Liparis tanakae TaxID=230148 RepID=A0A4Z2EQX4_9TELE|nr:hypothetical protein EYF80_058600 [Liparis tanakae]
MRSCDHALRCCVITRPISSARYIIRSLRTPPFIPPDLFLTASAELVESSSASDAVTSDPPEP